MKSRSLFSLALLGAFVIGLLSFAPVARAVEAFAVTTCKVSGAACIGGKNTSNGSGVVGTSNDGNGVVAQTKYVSKSATNYKSGLLGQDLSTSGKFNVGVTGTSTRGTGLFGTSSSNIGVNGISGTNTGVFGQVNGGGGQPTGTIGIDNSQNSAGAGLAGQTNVGVGVVGTTLASGNAGNSSESMLALAPRTGFLFVGAGVGNGVVATLDNGGNLTVATVSTTSSCEGCSRTQRVGTYAATAASPTIEDSGEANLIGGAAFVRLDPRFAATIDMHQGYYVLITPEAQTRGLYVAERSAGGFSVRENFAGRSSGPFAYRIVAHPYGEHAERLPRVQVRTIPAVTRQPIGVQETAPGL